MMGAATRPAWFGRPLTPHTLLFLFGTRPEAIKLAPTIREAMRNPAVVVRTCVTAQHRHLLDQMLGVFGIAPQRDLALMKDDQSLSGLTADAIAAIEGVLVDAAPDLVIVQGDTTTTMVGALGAFYRKIPVAHVEAGLRTRDKYAPFPEEINRRIVSVIADLHFAPTESARDNLLREGVREDRVFVVGNTVVDAAREVAAMLDAAGTTGPDWGPGRLVLVTAHRRESFGHLAAICAAIRRLVEEFADITVVFPVHPNPNVERVVRDALGGVERIRLVPPLDYVSFVQVLRRAHLVLTDSGGIQEEAPIFGKPVLLLRDVSERPEGLRANVTRLVGTRPSAIVDHARRLLRDGEEYERMARAQSPYGDGRASGRIVTLMTRFLDGEME
jgi:UDP-N-acetylglucosamine 2-epimerase (non-hydrolysing)